MGFGPEIFINLPLLFWFLDASPQPNLPDNFPEIGETKWCTQDSKPLSPLVFKKGRQSGCCQGVGEGLRLNFPQFPFDACLPL
jgi:hypothetical protein